jgi:hypothetical protein
LVCCFDRATPAPQKRFQKPEVADVYTLLRKYTALIVHFSGAKGSEVRKERLFPTDLRTVVADGAMGGLSCSTIRPSDDFNKHYWGSIGIVLGLKNRDSLIWAGADDGGSVDETIGENVVRTVENEQDLSLESLETTITDRTHHNEWVIRCYEVLGVFVHPICTAEEVGGEPRRIPMEKLLEYFPSLPMFSFRRNEIWRLGSPSVSIDHSQIYRPPGQGKDNSATSLID